MGLFGWIVAIALAGGVYFLSERIRTRPRRRREAALREVAARLGLTYERESDPYAKHPPLDGRVTRTMWQLERAFYGFPHHLSGIAATGPVRIFDVWHGNFGSGRSDPSRPCKLTVAAFHLEQAQLPVFRLAIEGRGEKLVGALLAPLEKAIGAAFQDIDFDEHPAFSGRYQLGGVHEAAVRALFHPEMIAFWDALPPEQRWAASGAGQSVVVYRDPPWTAGREAAVAPQDVEAFLRGAERIASAFSQQQVHFEPVARPRGAS